MIVAESAPGFEGHAMAAQLTELGIECTVITDSAVFAMLACVNKVIVGTHGVMANGGLIAHTGGLNIASACQRRIFRPLSFRLTRVLLCSLWCVVWCGVVWFVAAWPVFSTQPHNGKC